MRLSILILKLIITSTNPSVLHKSNVERDVIKSIDPEKIQTATDLFEDFPNSYDLNNTFSDKSVFFIQQYSRGINCREACSIESAARTHPNFQTNVFLTANVLSKNVMNSIPIYALLHYENINFYKVKLAEYEKGHYTDTADVKCTQEHKKCPNMLKYIILNKYPGIYIDLDLLVVQALDGFPFRNWVGQEEDEEYSDGLISFSDDQIGRTMANVTMSILEHNINKGDFNIENLVKRSYESICSVAHLTMDAQVICDGFKIYNKDYFQKISMKNFEKYFGKGDLNMTNVYTIRVYDEPSILSNPEEETEKQKLYVKISKKYCPWVNKLCNMQYKTNIVRTKLTFPILNSKTLKIKEFLPEQKTESTEEHIEMTTKVFVFGDDEAFLDDKDEFWITDSAGFPIFQ